MGCRVEEQLHCTVVIVRSKDVTRILSQPSALLHYCATAFFKNAVVLARSLTCTRQQKSTKLILKPEN